MSASATAVAPGRGRHALRAGAFAVALLAIALATTARGSLWLPAILGDHMVLQQDRAMLWGTATPGRTITAEIAGVTASAVADPRGAWRLALDGLAAGGPHDLTISGDGTLVLHDVLIGDVWLGVGQSNMSLAVRTASDGRPPATADDCRRLRFFTVERAAAPAPLRDVHGHWRVCTPETAAGFSAVAYFFGQDLTATLDVPIGLVVAAWGATPIEVWRGDAAATGAPGRDVTSATGVPFELSVADLHLVGVAPALQARPVALPPGSSDLGGDWRARAKPGSTAHWTPVAGEKNAGRFVGELGDPDAWASAVTALRPGRAPVDLREVGSVAFRARGAGEFRLVLGQASITDGDAHASEPIVPGATWTPYEIPLDALRQGGWGVKQPFTRDAVTTLGFAISAPPPRARGVAFNAMVAPLAPLRLRGVLWYQGEADVGHAADYATVLRELVTGWRNAWHDPQLPFLVVQLPGHGARPDPPGDSPWAEMREAQATVTALPATTVITTIDIGDAQDLHPRRKQELGRRLALAAESRVYGRDVTATGPRLERVQHVSTGHLTVVFENGGSPLATRDGAAPVGFAVSADGRRFAWADARISGPRTVEVWSRDVERPIEVRYAWADDPAANLTNAAGLPAAPFRSPVLDVPSAAEGASAGPPGSP